MVERLTRLSNFAVQFLAAFIAIAVSLAIFGKDLEEAVMPVQTQGTILDVERSGRRLTWTRVFCKNRDLHLASVAFVFFYANQPKAGGIPVSVINETLERPVGSVTYPMGCPITIRYSAMLPVDAKPGDHISGSLWYDSFHPFWLVKQDYGRVTIQ